MGKTKTTGRPSLPEAAGALKAPPEPEATPEPAPKPKRKRGRPRKAPEPEPMKWALLVDPVRVPFAILARVRGCASWLLDDGEAEALARCLAACLDKWMPELTDRWGPEVALALTAGPILAAKVAADAASHSGAKGDGENHAGDLPGPTVPASPGG